MQDARVLAAVDSRFVLERLPLPDADLALARDVRRGLSSDPKSLPSKYFYDERGSELFDEICDLPEYYLTRTETALLERHAADIIATANPRTLVELGAGTARKTRLLFDAAKRANLALDYVPLDVCEEILRSTGAALLSEYRNLRVHALVADYERHLSHLPLLPDRLIAFLGSTIGNLEPRRAKVFFERLAATLRPGEHFLLGADLVKPVSLLEAAYDDAAGVTAEFNRNVLRVLNRELDGDFDPDRFDHVARFDRRKSRMEMHLCAREAHRARLESIDLDVSFRAGEMIHTEISRKFTVERLERSLQSVGLAPVRWYLPDDDAYAVVLAERR